MISDPKTPRKPARGACKIALIVAAAALAMLTSTLGCTRQPNITSSHTLTPATESPSPVATPTTTTAAPASTPAPEPEILSVGILQEPDTNNFWNFYAGPGGTVWTQYVLEGLTTSLYNYSYRRNDWIPIVADGLPTPLARERAGDTEYWTSDVKLKKGLKWSDGAEITAHDFAFVVSTILDMELYDLGGYASLNVDPYYLSHVEALDSHTVKVFFHTQDEDGYPLTPGLSV